MDTIPKKVHYCWYSGEEKDERARRCIGSWHKHLPDYEIIEWNTSNCNVNETEFSKTAFEAKKWAQVADYFRLKILYEHGGIYLDADVLVNKSFDWLLNHRAFFPFEGYEYVINAVMGAAPGCEAINKMMEPYLSDRYRNSKQIMSFMHYMTEVLSNDYGFEKTGFTQILKNNIAVYSSNVLLINVDDGNNVCEHLYAGGWLDENDKFKEGSSYKYVVLQRYFYNLFGRPDLDIEDVLQPSMSEIVRKGIMVSDELKGLISSVKKGVDIVKSNPEQGRHLLGDIFDAVNAIAEQINIAAPSLSGITEDDITVLEEWLDKLP